jgi:hypothetical protein
VSSRRRTGRRKRKQKPQEPVYPTPEERKRIIRRRDKLLRGLIELFVTRPPAEHMDGIGQLVQTYGAAEVTIVLDKFQKSTQRPFVGEEAGLYRDYRLAFARFGGERRFLGKPECEELALEHTLLAAKREWKSLLRRGPSKRERELRNLLLIDERTWDDITPPAPPPRPPGFAAPPVGSYPPRLKKLLELGWKADEKAIAGRVGRAANWQPFIPDLERMVLDEGLLSGWPVEPPSWAPLHALRLLGCLRAHQSAGRLLALMDQEDDWLSDLLPSIWTEMGPRAAEPLWEYIQNRQHNPEQRGNVMIGLQKLAEEHRPYRREVVEGLSQLLDDAPGGDGTANAYIVHALTELGAVEALPALRRAYDEHKISLKIMTWDDVTVRLER